jgi:hypothetical protein
MRGYNGQSVKLTTHLYTVSISRMRGDSPLCLLYNLLTCYSCTLYVKEIIRFISLLLVCRVNTHPITEQHKKQWRKENIYLWKLKSESLISIKAIEHLGICISHDPIFVLLSLRGKNHPPTHIVWRVEHRINNCAESYTLPCTLSLYSVLRATTTCRRNNTTLKPATYTVLYYAINYAENLLYSKIL